MADLKKTKSGAYKVPKSLTKAPSENPKWLAPTFVTLFVVGVLWILVAYISGGKMPLNIGNWNLGIGFGFLMAGLLLLSRWR